jgi:hypothetical protein
LGLFKLEDEEAVALGSLSEHLAGFFICIGLAEGVK